MSCSKWCKCQLTLDIEHVATSVEVNVAPVSMCTRVQFLNVLLYVWKYKN